MGTFLLQLHHFVAIIFLVLCFVTILRAIIAKSGNKPFGKLDDKLTLFTLIFAHIQLILGFGVYATSEIVRIAFEDFGAAMKDPDLRWFAVEHITANIIGIALITVGRVRLKKIDNDQKKFSHIMMFFGIALILIGSRVPWDRLFWW